uniref:Uncharacterized protein n=1 Tax=Romanomermis culicivorax TaxID=13658 RepID=A0A915KCS2_ROMCU
MKIRIGADETDEDKTEEVTKSFYVSGPTIQKSSFQTSIYAGKIYCENL